MDLTNREEDLLEALSGTTKSALSLIPVLGQAIAGWEAYRRSSFDRNVSKLIEHLQRKVDDIESFFDQDYFQTEEGQQFTRKVIDAALDTQLEDKQELFVNALVNSPGYKIVDDLQKLKFIDMLRHLSRAALLVLAEMHSLLIKQVRGPGRNPDPISAFPLVDPSRIAEQLSDKYDPYLITSSINEMESQGLFSRTGEWRKDQTTGRYMPGGGFDTAMCYTDFAAKFVEFIVHEKSKKNNS